MPMLGAQCSPCCGCPKCTVGKLPPTITAKIQGHIPTSDGNLGNIAGINQILRAKVKSNFGTGARLWIWSPGGNAPSDDPEACPSDAGPLTNDPNCLLLISGGSGYAKLGRVKPTVAATVIDGSSRTLPVSVKVSEGSNGGVPFWFISEATVDGSPDTMYALVQFDFESGTVVAEMPYVDAYSSDLLVKGYFYKADASTVIKANVEVELVQKLPSDGSGAKITANIQDDPNVAGFGQIKSFTVDQGGDGYMAFYWSHPCDCGTQEYVLPQDPTNKCAYRLCQCEGGPSEPLVVLSATSCTGTGATGHATTPIGIPGKADGPITKTAVDSGGGGYAVLGRVQPTVGNVGGGSGAGLEITTTLKSNTGKCDLPTWGVKSVSVTNGGHNYLVGDLVTFGTDNIYDSTGGSHDETYGSGQITKTTTAAPTLEAQPVNGLTFSVSIASNGDTPQTWKVSKVNYSGNQDGLLDNQGLKINAGEHCTTFRNADVRIRTKREEPTVSASMSEDASGSAAAFGVTLSKFVGSDGRDAWKVTALSITNGGSGYAVSDAVEFSLESGSSHAVNAAAASVNKIDNSGVITGLVITGHGEYWKDAGTIDEVEIREGGSYAIAGIVEEIKITLAGNYYSDNTSATPIVPPVTVTLSQSSPSNGTDAEFGVVVNTDPQDGAFGSVTKFTITKNGDDYLAATTLTENCITVEYKGPDEKPTLSVAREGCNWTVKADGYVTDCAKFAWTHTPANCGGVVVTVTTGGEIADINTDHPCCGCCCLPPDEDPESTDKITLRASVCNNGVGTFVAGKKCDDVVCDETIRCCIAPDILGLSVEACETTYGGTVLPPGAPPEACDPENPCACTIGMAIDFTACPGNHTPGNNGSNLDGTTTFGVFLGSDIGGIGTCEKYYFFFRNASKVDFSEHCSPEFLCVGGALRYVYVNCQSGNVEIHDPADFFTPHDVIERTETGLKRVDGFGDEGGAECALALIPAP
jgi:hypothetical protein